jgi:hypothetical protein
MGEERGQAERYGIGFSDLPVGWFTATHAYRLTSGLVHL